MTIESVKDLGPLDWRVGIVDQSGRPTPEFQRRWNTQRNNNQLIGTITTGSGAPTDTTPDEGQVYIDISTTPWTFYAAHNGAWEKVGVYKFTDLSDVPHNYTSAGGYLVRVNSGATALEFDSLTATLDAVLGNTQGSIIYRGASVWTTLGPGTSGNFLRTNGTGVNPSWSAGNAGTVTSVTSANSDLTITNTTTTPVITVNSAPKWDTARTLSFTGDVTGSGSVDGSANVATALSYANVVPSTKGGAGSVSGVLKANGSGVVSAATSGTDYAPATSGSSILYANGSGGFSSVTIGANLTFSGGTLSASGGGTFANPTATASDVAVNGSASTYMRSDAAPAIQLSSSSQFGLVKVDGSTITASGGIISAVGGGSGSSYEAPQTKPLTSNFTLQNTGSSTLVSTSIGMALTDATASPSGIRFALSNTAPPATPYTVKIRMTAITPLTGNSYPGAIMVRNSSSGKIVIFGRYQTGYLVQNWNNYTGFASNIVSPTVMISGVAYRWWAISNDGTNLIYWISEDGYSWWNVGSSTLAGFISSVDQLGPAIFASTSVATGAGIQSYQVISGATP